MAPQNLTPKERVLKAIRHEKADRLPRGELLVEEAFLDRFYPDNLDAPYTEKMRRLAEEVGYDLVTVRADDEKSEEWVKELEEWTTRTSYFVMALVDGLFWKPEDPVSFEQFILGLSQGEEQILELVRLKKKKALQWSKVCLDAGAHGCIIGDDLAYDRGPFVSPRDLSKRVFPGLQEIAEVIRMADGVPFLHSCGNLTGIVELIVAAGFEGVHGLAPSAGNDPLAIQQMTHKKLTLMGVFELDRFRPHEIEAMKEELLQALAAEGGYILGSAEGLSKNTPLDSFKTLYQTMPACPAL